MSSEPQIVNKQRFVTSSDNWKLAFLCVLSRLNDSFLHLVCIRMCAERNLFVSGSTEEAQYAKSDRIAADVFTPRHQDRFTPFFFLFQIVPDIFSFWLLFLNPRPLIAHENCCHKTICHMWVWTLCPRFFFMWSKLKRKVKWKILPQICTVWGVISVWCSMHAASYTLSLRQ